MYYQLYACGCITKEDVPAIHRCPDHDKWIVAALERERLPKLEVLKNDRMRLGCCRPEPLLYDCAKKGKTFDLIYGYPDHNVLYAYNSIESEYWCDRINPLFTEMFAATHDQSTVVLVIEYTVLAKVLLDAVVSGFTIVGVNTIEFGAAFDKYQRSIPELYQYRVVVILGKGERDTVKVKNINGVSRYIESLDAKRALDLSGKFPYLHDLADLTVVITQDKKTYKRLAKEM